jgi:phosphoglycolate phosphatase
MSFSGAIFDLDGTLADTLTDIAAAMNRTLQERGFPVHHEEDYKFMVGRGLENLVTASLPPDQRLPGMITACHARFVADYSAHVVVETRLYDGIIEMLDALVRRDFRLSIFSNKAQDLTSRIVEQLLPGIPFVRVAGALPGQPKKPDPAVARALCEAMRLSPQEVVYLGDSDVDMMMANRAGLFAVGVTWGFRPAQELLDHGARALIHHPRELFALLGTP